MAMKKFFVQCGRKFLVVFLVLVMAVGMMGTVAFAVNTEEPGVNAYDTDDSGKIDSASPDSDLNSDVPAPATYTLTVNHVDENNRPLASAEFQILAVGSDYITVPRDDIDGYCFKGIIGDIPVAVMDSDKTVTFIYGVTAAPNSAENPDLFDIPDDDVPLADVPSTGDIAGLWMAISSLSAVGLVGLGLKRKKKDEEQDRFS